MRGSMKTELIAVACWAALTAVRGARLRTRHRVGDAWSTQRSSNVFASNRHRLAAGRLGSRSCRRMVALWPNVRVNLVFSGLEKKC